jgi:hypothetical protein
MDNSTDECTQAHKRLNVISSISIHKMNHKARIILTGIIPCIIKLFCLIR